MVTTPEQRKHGMESNLALLAEIIQDDRKVVFVTGAGISAASGVPTYRAPGGVWSRYVTEWGTKKKFFEDPAVWWNKFWLKTHQCDEFMTAMPNVGHFALTRIMNKFPEVRIITQNIDRLHIKAKTPEQRCIEIHGALGFYRCSNEECVLSRVGGVNVGNLSIIPPRCRDCGGFVLPMALFFDESYTCHSFFRFDEAKTWLKEADSVVFVGTSLSVGITKHAVEQSRGKHAFFFNVEQSCGEDGLRDVVGPCEETLCKLGKMVCS